MPESNRGLLKKKKKKNGISGSIPSTIGNLDQLKYFNLGTNQITGDIPDTMNNFTKLGIY